MGAAEVGMQRGTFGTALNGAVSPSTQQKEAMERPSAWARDEDLEEGRRLHDAKAVSAPAQLRLDSAAVPVVVTQAEEGSLLLTQPSCAPACKRVLHCSHTHAPSCYQSFAHAIFESCMLQACKQSWCMQARKERAICSFHTIRQHPAGRT